MTMEYFDSLAILKIISESTFIFIPVHTRSFDWLRDKDTFSIELIIFDISLVD